MPSRKRKQGQQRRLMKYIASQTGGNTHPDALVKREKEIYHKIEEMNKQIEEHKHMLSKFKNELNDAGDGTDTTDNVSKRELHEQQKKHMQFLIDMRNDMVETLHVNRRIYTSLQYMNDFTP